MNQENNNDLDTISKTPKKVEITQTGENDKGAKKTLVRSRSKSEKKRRPGIFNFENEKKLDNL